MIPMILHSSYLPFCIAPISIYHILHALRHSINEITELLLSNLILRFPNCLTQLIVRKLVIRALFTLNVVLYYVPHSLNRVHVG
jgi:hypothetical protein